MWSWYNKEQRIDETSERKPKATRAQNGEGELVKDDDNEEEEEERLDWCLESKGISWHTQGAKRQREWKQSKVLYHKRWRGCRVIENKNKKFIYKGGLETQEGVHE